MAIPEPGLRIGNSKFSSSLAGIAIPDPGVLIGNSSSSPGLGIGIGPDMRPRIDD